MTAGGDVESASKDLSLHGRSDRDTDVPQIPLSLRARLHYHSSILLMTQLQGDA